MKLFRSFIIIIYLLISFHMQGQDLEQHQWENRLVIVHANGVEQEKFRDQVAELLDDSSELQERKIVLYKIVDGDYKQIDLTNGHSIMSGKVSESIARNLLTEGSPFEVLLIGLDGGVKLRQNDTLTCDKLFELIDTMPMRQSEIRRKNKNKQ